MADTKSLVFPTDFSEASRAALDWVKRMADTLGATVHCVTCVHSPVILQPTVGAVYPTMEDLRGEAENGSNVNAGSGERGRKGST